MNNRLLYLQKYILALSTDERKPFPLNLSVAFQWQLINLRSFNKGSHLRKLATSNVIN